MALGPPKGCSGRRGFGGILRFSRVSFPSIQPFPVSANARSGSRPFVRFRLKYSSPPPCPIATCSWQDSCTPLPAPWPVLPFSSSARRFPPRSSPSPLHLGRGICPAPPFPFPKRDHRIVPSCSLSSASQTLGSLSSPLSQSPRFQRDKVKSGGLEKGLSLSKDPFPEGNGIGWGSLGMLQRDGGSHPKKEPCFEWGIAEEGEQQNGGGGMVTVQHPK